MSQCLAAEGETRVLDASQLVGPDQLADILAFLGMDEDACSAALHSAFSESSTVGRELAAEPGRA